MGVILGSPIWQPPGVRGSAQPTSVPKPDLKTSVHEILPGEPTEEAAKKWLQAQVPYRNEADDRGIAQRALHYSTTQKRTYEWRTYEMRDLWEALDHILRGYSLSKRFVGTEIHCPELYKMVETIVPRLEEAIMAYDPWFRVKGRDKVDRIREKSIQYWMEYLLDQAQFFNTVQPGIRSLVIYGFAAYKVWWDVTYQDCITRDVEQLDDSRNPRFRITPKQTRKLKYEGMRMELIDNYDWMTDLQAPDHQKSMWCGDTRLMTLEEIHGLADQGVFNKAAADTLNAQEPRKGTYSNSRWAKINRRLDSSDDLFSHKRAEGQPKQFEVTEMWCQWSPLPGVPAEEYVISCANETVCLRAQKNPHDDKHRPYAVARIQATPFDWKPVGMLDHALRVQVELDDHQNLAARSAARRQSPLFFLGHNSDAPSNLWDCEDGQVIRTDQKPEWFVPPGTYGDYLGFKNDMRREIEEISGAPRVYEGTDNSSGTATEIERKIQEGNRRLKSGVLAMASCYEQVLQQGYQLSAQYVTRRKAFRVLGREAAKANELIDISPDQLQDPIDFEFEGPRGLQNLGLRGTQVVSWMNAVAPLLQGLGGQLNIPALVRDMHQTMVGSRMGDDVLRVPASPEDLLNPGQENIMLAQGQDIGLHELDDHQAHILSHYAALDLWTEDNILNQSAIDVFMRHLQAHEMEDQRNSMRQQAMGQQPAFAEQAQIGGPQPVGGKGLNGRTPDLLGDGQAAQTPPGETPGPPNAARMGSPDRQSAIPMMANRY